MKSAIELYQDAYHLHFKENRPDLAKEIYQQIVEYYPESDERTYAQFLLNRISPPSEMPGEPANASFPIIATLAILIGFVALAGTVGLFFMMKQEQASALYFEKILLAVNDIQRKNYDQALFFLGEAKLLQPKRVAAYSLSSQIYLERNRFDLASGEYKKLLSQVPASLFAQEQVIEIAKKEKAERALELEQEKELPKLEQPEEVLPSKSFSKPDPKEIPNPPTVQK